MLWQTGSDGIRWIYRSSECLNEEGGTLPSLLFLMLCLFGFLFFIIRLKQTTYLLFLMCYFFLNLDPTAIKGVSNWTLRMSSMQKLKAYSCSLGGRQVFLLQRRSFLSTVSTVSLLISIGWSRVNSTDPSLLTGCRINQIVFLFTDRKPRVKIGCYRILKDVG